MWRRRLPGSLIAVISLMNVISFIVVISLIVVVSLVVIVRLVVFIRLIVFEVVFVSLGFIRYLVVVIEILLSPFVIILI